MNLDDIKKKWYSLKPTCKPCPKCKSQQVCMYHYRRLLKTVDIYFVSCEECGSSGEDRLTINGAIRAWNKRWRK